MDRREKIQKQWTSIAWSLQAEPKEKPLIGYSSEEGVRLKHSEPLRGWKTFHLLLESCGNNTLQMYFIHKDILDIFIIGFFFF